MATWRAGFVAALGIAMGCGPKGGATAPADGAKAPEPAAAAPVAPPAGGAAPAPAAGDAPKAPAPAAAPSAPAPPDGTKPGAAAGAPAGAAPGAPVPAGPSVPALAYALSDAVHGFLYLPSLDGTLDRIQSLLTTFDPNSPPDMVRKQFESMLPVPGDVLAAVDRTRPIVVLLLDPKDEALGPAPGVAVLPVADVAKLRAGLTTRLKPPEGLPEGVDPNDFVPPALFERPGPEGVVCFVPGERGGKPPEADARPQLAVFFAADHVVLGITPEAVLRVVKANRPAELPAAPTDDVIIQVDAGRLVKTFREDVDGALAEMRREMAREADQAPIPMPGIRDAMLTWVDLIKTAIGDVRGLRMGVRAADPTVRLRFAATFAGGSETALALKEHVTTTPDLVHLLPSDVQGYATMRMADSPRIREFTDSFYKAVFSQTPPDLTAEQKALFDRMKALAERTTTAGQTDAAFGGAFTRAGGLWVLELCRAKDPQAVREMLLGFAELGRDALGQLTHELPPGLEIAVTVEREAFRHRDVAVDRALLKLKLPEGDAEARLGNEVMRDLFGEGGIGGAVAVVKDLVVFSFGRGAEDRLRATLDLILDGKRAGPAGDLAAVVAGVPEGTNCVFAVAPLPMVEEGFGTVQRVRAGACLAFQADVQRAAQAFRTLNGAWPVDVNSLFAQQLLEHGPAPDCAYGYAIDVNSGAVSCLRHGTPSEPRDDEDMEDVFGFQFRRPAGGGDGAVAFFGRVFAEGGEVGVEMGIIVPHQSIKAYAEIGRAAMGGRGGGDPLVVEVVPAGPPLTEDEAALVASLKNLVTAQAQFQQMAFVDQDGDGLGEYGWLGELAGVEAPRGVSGKRAEAPIDAVLSAELGRKDAAGRVRVGGHYLRLFLPSDAQGAIGEPASLTDAGNAGDAEWQESRWIAYAWPVEPGAGRTFMVSFYGDVLWTSGEAVAYGGDRAPAPDAALDVAGDADTRHLDSGPALAALGLRAVDGNAWHSLR